MAEYTRFQVIANVETLPYRTGPNTVYPVEGHYVSGEVFLSSEQTVDAEGTLWVQNAETNHWSMFRSGTQAFLKVVPLPKPRIMGLAIGATYTEVTGKKASDKAKQVVQQAKNKSSAVAKELQKKKTQVKTDQWNYKQTEKNTAMVSNNRTTINTTSVNTWNYKQVEQFTNQSDKRISMDQVNQWNYHMTEQYASKNTASTKKSSTKKSSSSSGSGTTYIADPTPPTAPEVSAPTQEAGVTEVKKPKPIHTSSRIDKPSTSKLALSRVAQAATPGTGQQIILPLNTSKVAYKSGRVAQESRIPKAHSDGKDIAFDNGSSYPLQKGKNRSGEYQYDWSLNTAEIDAQVDIIRKNLNIPSLYNVQQVNRLMHTQFNRYKIAYPDFERNALIPYVFMTRPDLNLYATDGKTVLDQFYAVPSLQYLIEAYPMTARTLTLDFDNTHDFNPLLCNRIASLDVQDDVLEVGETGETFTGYKSQYAKHNIKGKTAGSFTIKFPETFNMSMTILHQIWCTYMSCVYRGLLEPKGKYIGGKILDYAVDIYYFLCDRDNIIRFWTKYYGCFPSNVNKSMLSFDAGPLITFPESSINYNYITKDEDMSPETISEFNNNSHITQKVQPFAKEYDRVFGQYGPTWCGAPFITELMYDEGDGEMVKRFVMRHKPAPEDTLVNSAISQSVLSGALNMNILAANSLNTAGLQLM